MISAAGAIAFLKSAHIKYIPDLLNRENVKKIPTYTGMKIPIETPTNKKSVPKYGKLSIGFNKPIDAFQHQSTQHPYLSIQITNII